MVNVPVKDQDFFALVDSMLCCNSHIIEEAEALNILAMSMVTGWAYNAVPSIIARLLLILRKNRIHGNQARLTC